MEIGYRLSSEGHGPNDLVANAKLAEDAGFEHVLIEFAAQFLASA